MRSSLPRRVILGAISVIVVLTALESAAAGKAVSVRYRLAEQPIVTYHHNSDGGVYFDILVLTDVALPRSASGSIRAGAKINGFGPDLSFATTQGSVGGFSGGTRTRKGYCYVQTTFDVVKPPPRSLRHPRPRKLVHVKVYIEGQTTPIARDIRLRSGAAQDTDCRHL